MWRESIERGLKLLYGERHALSVDNVRSLLEAVFDGAFYARTYLDLPPGEPLLEHYLIYGWRERRNPSALFETGAYLDADPVLKSADICPLVHYVLSGAGEVRSISERPQPSWRRKTAAHFDRGFYHAAYQDIGPEIDGFEHYLAAGWRERRNPSAHFDTQYYLETNDDVRAAEICPLVHYATTGIEEGRLPVPPADPVDQVLAGCRPMAERIMLWPRPVIADANDTTVLRTALLTATAEFNSGLVLAYSHDDYVEVTGGVQNCVTDDHHAFVQAGFTFVHARAARPLPVLAIEQDIAQPLMVRVNGKPVGAVAADLMARTIAHIRPAGMPLYVVVHHLMGHAPEAVTNATQLLRPQATIVWVHDFFTLCPHYALLRNDLAFCHCPDEKSKACGICIYGTERSPHLARMREMFGKLQPIVLTPSETAARLWRARGNLPHKEIVVRPHARLMMDDGAGISSIEYPLRIGFLGFPLFHKGWETFAALAAKHFGDRRYRFYHLGGFPGQRSPNIEFVKVEVTPNDREAMVREVRVLDLDIVVNWSLCYETFSFTAHEAVAGGALVIARRSAGNVWPAVSHPDVDRGVAVDTEEQLFELFATGQLLTLDLRHRYGSLISEAATAGYLLGNNDGG